MSRLNWPQVAAGVTSSSGNEQQVSMGKPISLVSALFEKKVKRTNLSFGEKKRELFLGEKNFTLFFLRMRQRLFNDQSNYNFIHI